MSDNNNNWGGMITGGIPIVGGLLSNIFNNRAQKKTNAANQAFQIQENEKGRNFAREMWNADNEYNSPSEQMKRLKNAGINPHLAYANGSPMNTANAVNPSGVSSSPSAISPRMEVGGMFQNILGAQMMKAQIDNINADTNKKNVEAEGTGVNTSIATKQLENLAIAIPLENAIKQSTVDSINSNIRLNDVNINKVTQEITNLISTNENIKKDWELKVSQLGLNQQQSAIFLKQLAVMKSVIDQNMASAEASKASASLSRQKALTETYVRSNIEEQTRTQTETTRRLNRENMIGDETALSNARANSKKLEAEAKKAFNVVRSSELYNEMLKKKLTEQDYINTIRMFETGETAVGSVLNSVKSAFPDSGERTTTRYDADGNYRGHSTSRRGR